MPAITSPKHPPKSKEKQARGGEGGGRNKRKPGLGLARLKATPALKKEVANFNSPVERVRGTYRSQDGCVLLLPGGREEARGWSRRPHMESPQSPWVWGSKGLEEVGK